MNDDDLGVQEERHLLDILAQIRRAHEEAAKPYVDRLIAIRSLRPPAPIFVEHLRAAMAPPKVESDSTPGPAPGGIRFQ